MLRAVPFGYQMHPQFFTLHLCSASNVQQRRDWGCDLTLKKSLELRQPTPCSKCSDIFHRRKKLSTGLSFITFWQRFLNWIRSALDQWLIYFLLQNAPFQSSVLISVGKKKVWLLKENTFCNSRKVNILTGAAEGCVGLFKKLNYLITLLDLVFSKVSYQI